MSRLAVSAFLSILFLLPAVTAQFQFFGDFFGHQGQQQGQQQERQNVASDSNWYRQTWESGKHSKPFILSRQNSTSVLGRWRSVAQS